MTLFVSNEISRDQRCQFWVLLANRSMYLSFTSKYIMNIDNSLDSNGNLECILFPGTNRASVLLNCMSLNVNHHCDMCLYC